MTELNPIEWKDSQTLEEWLKSEFEAGRAGSPEVKAIVAAMPKEKRDQYRKLYAEWKAGKA